MSKIVRVEASPFQLTYKPGREFVVTYGAMGSTSNVLVKIITEDGTEGYGEATPLPPFNGETQESVMGIMRLFAAQMIGEDATDISKIYRKLDAYPGNPSAKSGVDVALYDILGKESGMPVYKLLGGKFRTQIPLHYTLSIDAPEKMAGDAVKLAEEGFRTLEVKVGRYKGKVSIADDVARVKAVRDAVGSGMILIVDCNTGWTVAESIEAIGRLEGLDVLVEQPVRTLEELREVKRKVSAPLIADESCQGVEDAARIIEEEAADIISMKLTKVGGFYKAQRILSLCDAFRLRYRYDNQIQGRLASTASAHLAMAYTDGIPSGGTQFLRFSDDLEMEGGLKYERGTAALERPDAPGLGLTIRQNPSMRPIVFQ